MKQIFLLIVTVFTVLTTVAQETTPRYIDVIKKFCSQYEPSEDYENYTTFAKKKNGWYVMQINKVDEDKFLNEQLFYSFTEKKYFDLSSLFKPAENPDIEKQLERFCNYGGSITDWYGFERIPYYGYNGWYNDVIKDFQNPANLSDTLYDGLARAYTNLALSYSWYQQGGGSNDSDTLHTKLQRLQYPGKERIEKMRIALHSAINTFNTLSKQNPQYVSIVGNAPLKLFNEQMNAYSQMLMCNQDVIAKEFLSGAYLPEPYATQGKNYLNSCEPNAILFTYGDNDTYQLWYLQEKFNFRKDITVINYSLLGLPVYIEMLKRKKAVTVNVPQKFLANPYADIVYFNDPANKKTLITTSLKQLLQDVYTKRYPITTVSENSYPGYPYKSAYIDLPVGKTTAKKRLTASLSKYYFLNDIAMFDILVNNTLARPVYFTTNTIGYFDEYLMQKGIVYKLETEKETSLIHQLAETGGIKKFIEEKYLPVLSNNMDILCFDGDNTFFTLHFKMLNFYLAKKDTAACKLQLQKLEAVCPEIKTPQLKAAKNLIYFYAVISNSEKAVKLADQYAVWLHDVYLHPKPLTGFYTKKAFEDELKLVSSMLAVNDYKSDLVDSLLNNL